MIVNLLDKQLWVWAVFVLLVLEPWWFNKVSLKLLFATIHLVFSPKQIKVLLASSSVANLMRQNILVFLIMKRRPGNSFIHIEIRILSYDLWQITRFRRPHLLHSRLVQLVLCLRNYSINGITIFYINILIILRNGINSAKIHPAKWPIASFRQLLFIHHTLFWLGIAIFAMRGSC